MIDRNGCARVLADGLILDEWMPGHPRFRPAMAPWVPPPGPGRCQHGKREWFTMRFDKDSPESQSYFASACDVNGPGAGPDAYGNNKLSNMCNSARDTFFIPYHNTHGTKLYLTMLRAPDLFLQWHNASSGGFYLCVGCANCSSVTKHYQPQNQVDELCLNPQSLLGKDLKKNLAVQQAFRSFLAAILEDPDLVAGERCRHLHSDTPAAWR